MYDLSILIPSRNEMFLNKTVADLLSNIRGKTEIIVALDGEWPEEGLPDDPRLTLLYLPESVGQRAATNLACRLSGSKYVMKIDAHCAVDEGFDVKMMEKMQDDYTMVPKMYNLHVFDWVCKKCGQRRYQGKSGVCKECGGEEYRDEVWYAKPSPETTAMRFDRNLRFQYWSGYKRHQEGDVVETMSILGACFMLTREKYWELDICDEGHGSWGQQGTEVACKTWLSGGKLMCNRTTWFAHLFRTQGGDFGFPYPNPGISAARDYSKDLWLNDKWPKAKHKLSWLIDKFSPPDWETNKGILYYTDNQLQVKIAKACQRNLTKMDIPITSVSLKPMPHFGNNIHFKGKRGYLTMFKQILKGLEAMDCEIVYFCEHDVYYHPSHFDFKPKRKDVFYYNTNVWKMRASDGHSLYTNDCKQVSGLVGFRVELIKHYKERIERVEKEGRYTRNMGFEPGTAKRVDWTHHYTSEAYESKCPNVDIRHDNNLTPSRWSKDLFRNKRWTEGWTETKDIPCWGTSVHDKIK